MELQNFTSILEIFATFSLAYIIIDELTENPFISLVSEKILKKYKLVKQPFLDLQADVTGKRTTLNSYAQITEVTEKEDYKNGAPHIERLLRSTEERISQSLAETTNAIRENHATYMFVYINCYLFLYCILILFCAGIYVSEKFSDSAEINLKIDSALFIFYLQSLLYILFCWTLETIKKKNKKKSDFVVYSETFNGYIIAVCFIIVVCVVCLGFYLSGFKCYNIFSEQVFHNSLLMAVLTLPLINYIVYIFKANNRAKAILPVLSAQSAQFKDDYMAELNTIQKFINMCDYHIEPKIIPPTA